jgi:2'-5' RNA ligase
MPGARVFLSFEPPKEIRTALATFQSGLRRALPGLGWVDPALFHSTITFLGELEAATLAALVPEIASIARAHPAFDITYEGVGVFPDLRTPSVLWVGCVPAGGELAGLKSALDAAALRRGIAVEERPFRPHLTLARFRPGSVPVHLTPTLESLTFEPRRTSITGIRVMKSDLSTRGPAYTVLADNPLHERTSLQDP